MPDKIIKNKDNPVDNATIEVDELVDVDELQSVLTQNEDDEIGSSAEKEQGPLQLLLEKGKKEGFITYAELNENLPEGTIETDRLEEIVELINDLGISVQEHAPKAEQNINTVSTDPDATVTTGSEIGKTTDPVRMYMREMGTIELLDRQGEITIAKRIEGGNKIIQETLGSFIPVLIFIGERYQTLQEDIKADPEKDNTKYLEIFVDFKDESDEITQINRDDETEIISNAPVPNGNSGTAAYSSDSAIIV